MNSNNDSRDVLVSLMRFYDRKLESYTSGKLTFLFLDSIIEVRCYNPVASFHFSRFIYPGLVALIISSLTFPPGLGQFFSGEVSVSLRFSHCISLSGMPTEHVESSFFSGAESV